MVDGLYSSSANSGAVRGRVSTMTSMMERALSERHKLWLEGRMLHPARPVFTTAIFAVMSTGEFCKHSVNTKTAQRQQDTALSLFRPRVKIRVVYERMDLTSYMHQQA
jgi:hypothetical protein